MRITGGTLKNHPLISPKGTKTRPTSDKLRQSLFNICQHHVEGATFLDLFAGSGAVGIEALSRGASSATFIEKERLAANTLRKNLESLNLTSQSTLLIGDVLTLLKKLKGKTFDLIYVDPPYEKGFQEKTLLLIDTLGLLAPDGLLFLEESSSHPLSFSPLKSLALQKTRKVGSTSLYQFIKKEKAP